MRALSVSSRRRLGAGSLDSSRTSHTRAGTSGCENWWPERLTLTATGAAQVGLHPQAQGRGGVHGSVEDLRVAGPAALGPVHRDVRVTEDVVGVLVARGSPGDAHAGGGEELVAADLERRAQLVVDAVG